MPSLLGSLLLVGLICCAVKKEQRERREREERRKELNSGENNAEDQDRDPGLETGLVV